MLNNIKKREKEYCDTSSKWFTQERHEESLRTSLSACRETLLRKHEVLRLQSYGFTSDAIISLVAHDASEENLRVVLENTPTLLAAPYAFTPEQIFMLAVHDTGASNIRSVLQHYAMLEEMGFMQEDILRMANCSGGSHNIMEVYNHHAALLAMGLHSTQIVGIAARKEGYLALLGLLRTDALSYNTYDVTLEQLVDLASHVGGESNIAAVCASYTALQQLGFSVAEMVSLAACDHGARNIMLSLEEYPKLLEDASRIPEVTQNVYAKIPSTGAAEHVLALFAAVRSRSSQDTFVGTAEARQNTIDILSSSPVTNATSAIDDRELYDFFINGEFHDFLHDGTLPTPNEKISTEDALSFFDGEEGYTDSSAGGFIAHSGAAAKDDRLASEAQQQLAPNNAMVDTGGNKYAAQRTADFTAEDVKILSRKARGFSRTVLVDILCEHTLPVLQNAAPYRALRMRGIPTIDAILEVLVPYHTPQNDATPGTVAAEGQGTFLPRNARKRGLFAQTSAVDIGAKGDARYTADVLDEKIKRFLSKTSHISHTNLIDVFLGHTLPILQSSAHYRALRDRGITAIAAIIELIAPQYTRPNRNARRTARGQETSLAKQPCRRGLFAQTSVPHGTQSSATGNVQSSGAKKSKALGR